MSHKAYIFEYRDNYRATLLAAIPFAVVGLASLNAPMLHSATRLAATVGLLVVATALAVHGWPRRRQIRFDQDGHWLADDGRSSMRLPTGLALVASAESRDGSAADRIQLVAESDQGPAQVLIDSSDLAVVLTLAMQLAERRHLRVEVRLPMCGDSLPPGFVRASNVFDPPLTSGGKVLVDPGVTLWIAGGGCLFVLVVVGSLLRAHALRGGWWHLNSLLLVAALVAIALAFMRWTREACLTWRRCVPRSLTAAADGNASRSDVVSSSTRMSEESRASAPRRPNSRSHWLLFLGSGKSCHLVTLRRQRFDALGLPWSRREADAGEAVG